MFYLIYDLLILYLIFDHHLFVDQLIDKIYILLSMHQINLEQFVVRIQLFQYQRHLFFVNLQLLILFRDVIRNRILNFVQIQFD